MGKREGKGKNGKAMNHKEERNEKGTKCKRSNRKRDEIHAKETKSFQPQPGAQNMKTSNTTARHSPLQRQSAQNARTPGAKMMQKRK
jgi:hypothetical protein